MKKICIRCEALERPQKSKTIHSIKNSFGDSVPLCSVCIEEIKEEEDGIKNDDYFESLLDGE